MIVIPLEVQTEVLVDSTYNVEVSQEEGVNADLGVGVEVRVIECTAGNGLVIQDKEISIDPELILDCGTSTTVLHGGVT